MRRAWVLVAVGVLAAVLLALTTARVGDRGRFAAPYSTYGAGPRGSKALYELARALGFAPVRWADELQWLPAGGVLVALGGCDHEMPRELRRKERDALVRWVEAGGTLLVAGAAGYLPDALGLSLRPAPACANVEELEVWLERGGVEGADADTPAADGEAWRADPLRGVAGSQKPGPPAARRLWTTRAGAALEGLAPIELVLPATVEMAPTLVPEVLLEADGVVAAVRVRRGRGAVIALGSASMFQNRSAEDGGGARLFARLVRHAAPAGPVYFDEYHLGVGERRSAVQVLRAFGGGPLLLAGLFVAALVFWRRGTRLGRPRAARPPPPAGTLAHVSAMGLLYERTGDLAAAIVVVARRALRVVADHHRAPSAEPRALCAHLEALGRSESVDAVRRIAGLEARAHDLGSRAAAHAVREIDRLVAVATRRLLHGGGRHA